MTSICKCVTIYHCIGMFRKYPGDFGKVRYMLSELQTERKTVGLKQSVRKISGGEAKKAFLAQDAAPQVTDGVVRSCEQNGIPVEWIATMNELGRACGIDVGAAVAVVY